MGFLSILMKDLDKERRKMLPPILRSWFLQKEFLSRTRWYSLAFLPFWDFVLAVEKRQFEKFTHFLQEELISASKGGEIYFFFGMRIPLECFIFRLLQEG